jgi:hypothetical protein
MPGPGSSMYPWQLISDYTLGGGGKAGGAGGQARVGVGRGGGQTFCAGAPVFFLWFHSATNL